MRWTVAIALLVALGGAAHAADGEPADVIVSVGSGLQVNWSRLVLEARATARTHGTEDTRALEELARREIQVAMEQGAARVPIRSDTELASLYEDPALGRALRARLSRWEVTEARYYASGQVELVAELSLQELVKPWTIDTARPVDPDAREPRYTGLVVDARGTELTPAWSPRVVDAAGNVLFEGLLWEQPAVTLGPVVYVTDPAHPAASRAGEEPMFVRVTEARGSDAVLAAEEAVRFRSAMAGARVLGEGTVVVVVDP